MNSFCFYITVRIVAIVALLGVAGTTVHTVETQPGIVQETVAKLWDAVKPQEAAPEPERMTSLMVLSETGTPVYYTLPHCPFNDEPHPGCIFKADERGNLMGRSYVQLGGLVFWEAWTKESSK